MSSESERCRGQGHEHTEHARGPSSFWLQDPSVVFNELGLGEGGAFLDAGCGPGDYSLHAARIVADSGAVYALDREGQRLEPLRARAASAGLTNVTTVAADLTRPLPLPDRMFDVCLIANVLHSLDLTRDGPALFREARRVLKPGGRLAVLECAVNAPLGPPQPMRLSAEQIERAAAPYGFVKRRLADLGHNHLILLTAAPEEGSHD